MLHFKNILIFFFVLLLFSESYNKPLCNSTLDCHTCDFCGLESENYFSCFYQNIFCLNDSKIIYSSYLKDEYTSFFENDPEIDDELCGEIEYELENRNEGITIFTNKNKTFPKNSKIRCHYIIDSINKNYDLPYLEISMKNVSQSNETKITNGFKAEIGAIFSLTDSDREEVEIIKGQKLFEKFYINNLRSVTKLEIFLDFETDIEYPYEILEIKIDYGQIFSNFSNKYHSTYYDNAQSTSTSNSNESSSSSDALYGGIGGGAAAFILLCIVGYCCCCKTEKRYVEVETTRCALQ